MNWSPAQHPVIIMASFSSNCLEILSEYVWHSELLPLRFTWVNILFLKSFIFTLFLKLTTDALSQPFSSWKIIYPCRRPCLISKWRHVFIIKEKCLMEFKIVDFLKSTEYEEGKKFANLSFVIPLNCVYGSTVRSISRFHKERSQDLNQFQWLCGHSPATSPEGIHRSERGNIIKTESSASQTCAPAHCNCTFMKKVDGPKMGIEISH